MTGTGLRWFRVVVRLMEPGPQSLVDKMLLCRFLVICKSWVAHVIKVGHAVNKIERRTWSEEEGDKFTGERIERNTRAKPRYSGLRVSDRRRRNASRWRKISANR